MGGAGSGTWWRWDKKTTVDELKQIDIRYMKKQNMLRPGYMGSLSWSCRGEETGSIRYRMFSDEMILSYRYRRNGDDGQDVHDTVMLNKTPCNFGRSRTWFICPSCDRRVGILYDLGKYFRCRHCTGLAYSSQQEGSLDRMARKARKIRRKLAVDSKWWDADCLSDPIFMKPKGMHWKTYERLKKAENHCQGEIERIFVSRFGHGWY